MIEINTGASREEIRTAMRAMRRALRDTEQARQAQLAAGHILASPQYARAKTVMAYIAVRGELALDAVIADVLASGRRLALPLCEGPGIMTARAVRGMDELSPGAYGIMEPGRGCAEIPPGEIDLVLVPGTAFDRFGGRIGQGGGYYDRYLPQTGAYRMGVCHDFALLDEALPMEAHDARMDAAAVPDGIVTVNRLNGKPARRGNQEYGHHQEEYDL